MQRGQRSLLSWLSHRLDKSAARLAKPWVETPDAVAKRVQECFRDLNRTCNTKQLCLDLPKRLSDLTARGGDRLPS